MTTKLQVRVYCFFAAFFMLLASCRMGSSDAFAQLQAATILATKGELGTYQPPGKEWGLWVMNSAGRYYEAHDLGNIVLMYLPARIGTLLTHASADAQIEAPSIATRFGVSVSIVLWSAVGCLFMVKLFHCFLPFRPSFLLGLAFATTTPFWPYTKTAWDVCGGCVGVSILLYGAARMLSTNPIPRTAYITTALGFVIAVSFRYSTGPFLALSILLLVWNCRSKLDLRHLAMAALIVSIGIVPTLIYNYVRMGSPLRPATTAAQYAVAQGLRGSIPKGLFGLILSPNRGLLWFSPLCLLLFALPFVWFRIPKTGRQLTWIFGLGAALYTVMIAKIPNWGAFGWGPRYLVPVLPIIFTPVALTIWVLWSRRKKILLPLVVLSVALNGMAVLVNWDLATAEYPPSRNIDPLTAMLPYQQMSVWHGFGLGLQGKPLPGGHLEGLRIAAARFPDLWEVRMMEYSRVGVLLGVTIFILLSAATFWLLWELVGKNSDSKSGPLSEFGLG